MIFLHGLTTASVFIFLAIKASCFPSCNGSLKIFTLPDVSTSTTLPKSWIRHRRRQTRTRSKKPTTDTQCYDFISHGSSWFCLHQYVHVYPFKGHVGTPIPNYHYVFKNGWFSHGEALCEHTDVFVAAGADDATQVLKRLSRFPRRRMYNSNPPKTSKKTFRWTQNIDKNHYLGYIGNRYFKSGLGGSTFQDTQPSVGFGLMAVSKISLDLTHTKESYQDVSAFCQVNLELVLRRGIDSTDTQHISLPHAQTFYIRGNHGMDGPLNARTKGGLYTWRTPKGAALPRRRSKSPTGREDPRPPKEKEDHA